MTQAATRPAPTSWTCPPAGAASRRGTEPRSGAAGVATADDRLEELLALAHEVRMAWCGPEVEVEASSA
ncbi:hypothetical protein I553_3944 [Mycobacterium xenopi 4042]|uniref:Uncharacterized protein n=1 Tax=Mycobacterium xenopi 4042 TaxID=1299334 RepID=X8DJA5_MYCXE|nr:hypothetical protein I553_3944 [Mycobacterium xenopi 4042]